MDQTIGDMPPADLSQWQKMKIMEDVGTPEEHADDFYRHGAIGLEQDKNGLWELYAIIGNEPIMIRGEFNDPSEAMMFYQESIGRKELGGGEEGIEEQSDMEAEIPPEAEPAEDAESADDADESEESDEGDVPEEPEEDDESDDELVDEPEPEKKDEEVVKSIREMITEGRRKVMSLPDTDTDEGENNTEDVDQGDWEEADCDDGQFNNRINMKPVRKSAESWESTPLCDSLASSYNSFMDTGRVPSMRDMIQKKGGMSITTQKIDRGKADNWITSEDRQQSSPNEEGPFHHRKQGPHEHVPTPDQPTRYSTVGVPRPSSHMAAPLPQEGEEGAPGSVYDPQRGVWIQEFASDGTRLARKRFIEDESGEYSESNYTYVPTNPAYWKRYGAGTMHSTPNATPMSDTAQETSKRMYGNDNFLGSTPMTDEEVESTGRSHSNTPRRQKPKGDAE